MSTEFETRSGRRIVYPETDGQPMGENTLQFRWIFTLYGGLAAMFRNELNVFVAGDLFWYPVEGQPGVRTAPDCMVVFGRPKGDRGSYRQWEEGGVAPQVAFEVLSPSKRVREMVDKFHFYQRYGVEEYYVYDPQQVVLEGWLRQDDELRPIDEMHQWRSPRLQTTFDVSGEELRILDPNGQPFATYLEAIERAETSTTQMQQERDRADRLAAQLRALGVEPEQ